MSNASNSIQIQPEFEVPQDNLGRFDEEFLGQDSNTLIVNLEDILLEEDVINNILVAIHQRKLVSNLCSEWWRKTGKSSVKQMDILFKEQTSKKLIKYYQAILCMSI